MLIWYTSLSDSVLFPILAFDSKSLGFQEQRSSSSSNEGPSNVDPSATELVFPQFLVNDEDPDHTHTCTDAVLRGGFASGDINEAHINEAEEAEALPTHLLHGSLLKVPQLERQTRGRVAKVANALPDASNSQTITNSERQDGRDIFTPSSPPARSQSDNTMMVMMTACEHLYMPVQITSPDVCRSSPLVDGSAPNSGMFVPGSATCCVPASKADTQSADSSDEK